MTITKGSQMMSQIEIGRGYLDPTHSNGIFY